MVTVVEMTDYQMGWIDYENGLPLEGADWDEDCKEDQDYIRGWKAAETFWTK